MIAEQEFLHPGGRRDLFHRWPRREETAAEVISLEEKVAAQGVATAENWDRDICSRLGFHIKYCILIESSRGISTEPGKANYENGSRKCLS